MAKKDERFVIAHQEGSILSDIGERMILVDKVTGVNYLWLKAGSAAGITPLLNADGKPVVTYDIKE